MNGLLALFQGNVQSADGEVGRVEKRRGQVTERTWRAGAANGTHRLAPRRGIESRFRTFILYLVVLAAVRLPG